jgi:hypothetical protein
MSNSGEHFYDWIHARDGLARLSEGISPYSIPDAVRLGVNEDKGEVEVQFRYAWPEAIHDSKTLPDGVRVFKTARGRIARIVLYVGTSNLDGNSIAQKIDATCRVLLAKDFIAPAIVLQEEKDEMLEPIYHGASAA